ncbi:MAG: hypothetical protein M1820_009886 [Bogoriella megaspora]|nr:MAG: hypothetical protein M1820_009886 [Bogoriella megaspora]
MSFAFSEDHDHVAQDGYQDASRMASYTSRAARASVSAAALKRAEMNAMLANPLRFKSKEELMEMGIDYAREHALVAPDDMRAFKIGAVLAAAPEKFADCPDLTEEELTVLKKEWTHKWSQPRLLYAVIILCSMCAAVQGMANADMNQDETVVNGAQIFYGDQFGIGGTDPRSTWLLGLLNSAPYLCCAFIGCWLTIPYNNWFGRRGTIFITCLFSALACFWQGFVNTWWSMFVARFALGFGIGPKSATVPIYAAETTPPAIRGALVMQWQMWTAFGIMFGYIADLAFYYVPDKPHIIGLNWRLMMASAMMPAVIVCCFVFFCPESPRWYIQKGRHYSAYEAMCRLRFNKVQAARDIFYMAQLLETEAQMSFGQNKVKELLTVPRNRHAMVASEIVMFMQQFCGVNALAYYSSAIFEQSGFETINALAASLGFGVINFVFALPAVYTIDTFGRRNLLLTTFPLMSLSLLFTGFCFWIPQDSNARVGLVALGIYLFGIVYSPGEGPVPFTYSAEAYPLYVRTYGMSLATATTWFFNFVLSITWPSLVNAFKPQGAFGWYAAWNVVGWIAILLFVPETKEKTLEELDAVFEVSLAEQAAFGLRQAMWFVKRYILFQRNAELKPLVDPEERQEERRKNIAKA